MDLRKQEPGESKRDYVNYLVYQLEGKMPFVYNARKEIESRTNLCI